MKTLKLPPLLLLLLLPIVAQAQWSYSTNGDGTLTITNYNGASDVVTIPSMINGRSVTAIGYAAFYDSGVTSVTIPDSVTSIGNFAFSLCSDLTTVTVGKSVASIGSYAFWDCFSLNEVYFSGNTPITDSTLFANEITTVDDATVYYLPGTTNWDDFALSTGVPTVLWNPQAQTGDGSFGVRNNQFGFNITGTSNLVIVVQACTNLANSVWTPVATNTLTGGTSYFSDPQWTSFPGRFYRFSSP